MRRPSRAVAAPKRGAQADQPNATFRAVGPVARCSARPFETGHGCRRRDLRRLARHSSDDAYNDLQEIVEESIFPDADGVHCSVLAWRAWATLDLTGKEHADTLLRQSVHYCLGVERRAAQGTEPTLRTRSARGFVDRTS